MEGEGGEVKRVGGGMWQGEEMGRRRRKCVYEKEGKRGWRVGDGTYCFSILTNISLFLLNDLLSWIL